MIELRVASTDADYEAWAAIKSRVVPSEPVTAKQLRDQAEDGRLLLVASVDGQDAGCGIGARSDTRGRAFLAARVLPQHRRRGVGAELVRALVDHARALGLADVNAFVDAAEPEPAAFAERYGLQQVDFQLQQIREVGDEAASELHGIDLVALGDRREELLRAAWPVAEEAYADFPVPGELAFTLEQWLHDEATLPAGSFVALELGDVVGYAGLVEHASAGTAEHGLTAVRRDRRGRGIARALKRAQLHWAAQNRIDTLVTWTQQRNDAMQALNRSLGYRDVGKVLTMQGALPV
ncbi:MAG TPA: GNAT family N-acetyltransferase [Gaiellaceae bacterium]|jgi:GNAT superfamily N-acetyltransferase